VNEIPEAAPSGETTWTLADEPGVDSDRYELVSELATGGMATVYLARLRGPMGFTRLVAIKCMHPQYAKDPTFSSMFVDEAMLTARLRHPNIVPTLDVISENGQLLLVMEYVEGASVAKLMRVVREASAQVPIPIACAIVHDLLLGLHEAHETRDDDGTPLGVIHRDVSPQNAIVGVDGLARVLDFGIAKARGSVHQSHDGEIKGKIPYMPPEQLFGEPLDRTVDVYAAGVVLWELLTGERLFDGPSTELLVRRIAGGDVAPASKHRELVSPELDALVLRALSQEPHARFPTALAMAEHLSAIVALPPRTEIASWVKRFATKEPPVPVRRSERTPPRQPRQLGEVVECDSERRPRPVFDPEALTRRVGAPAPITDTSAVVSRTPRTPPRRVRTTFVAVAALALGLGVATLTSTRGAASTTHATAAGAAAPQVEKVSAPIAPVVAAIESVPVIAPQAARMPSQPTTMPAVRTRALTASVAAPAVVTTVVAEQAPAPAPAVNDGKPASCRLPYVVDAEGHRHYKVECL
jgi:serine/threonine-protein kinase